MTGCQFSYINNDMGRPRKVETLTTAISGRIRRDQDLWLRLQADRKFEGELSRTLRWALDQAQVFTSILLEPDPARALDEMLHPEMYEMPDPEREVTEAETELKEWQQEQAIKRARRKRGVK